MVVSAKFGGEFKIMYTMRKSKATSIEKFAEKCTQDSLKMFSRSWSAGVNLLVLNNNNQGSESNTNNTKQESSKNKNQTQM